MSDQPVSANGQRPVAMGCTLVILAIVVSVVVVGGCIAFAESGADSGKTVLLDADAYDYETITFNGERNFYLTRLPSGDFVAFSDLDAANRANSSRQCRVLIIDPVDPAFRRFSEEFQRRFSAESGGSKAMFREACNDAVYDLAGNRIDDDGRNLDRFEVSIDRENHVIVDVSKRTCSLRAGTTFRQGTNC